MGNILPRTNLFKADYTDPEEVIKDINTNFDIIDASINANTFTSSTRPLNPYDGRLIYETDTHLVSIYLAGTGWVYVGGDAFARGKRAVITADADSGTTTNAEIGPFISVTYTSELNRRYWIESTFNCAFTGSGNGVTCLPRVRWAAGGTVTTAGTQLGSDTLCNVVYGAGSAQDFFMQHELAPNIAGNVTVGLFLAGSSGKTIFFDQAFDRSAFLIARDVGSL